MAHFVVLGEDIAGTAAALEFAALRQPVTLLESADTIPIPDMWKIGKTPLNREPTGAAEWYDRRYDWLNAAGVRWSCNTPGLPFLPGDVEEDPEGGELLIKDPSSSATGATAVVYTETGRSPDPPGNIGIERFFGRGVSWSTWSDGPFFRNRPVAVFGCGAHALEQAGDIATFSSKVTVLCEEPALSVHDDLTEVARLPNVELYPGVSISAVVPSASGGIARVEYQRNGVSESVEAAAVFVAYDPQLSWNMWGGRDRALNLVKQQRLYLAGVAAGVPYRDHNALFEDGRRAAREAVERWGAL